MINSSFRWCVSAPLCRMHFTSVISAACLVSTVFAQSKLPIQRFGISDFRLTDKGGNDRTFRFAPDGKRIAGANWQQVRLWSFPDGKLLHDFSSAVQTNCIEFAAGGKQLLALYQRQMEIQRFDVETGQLISRTKLADVPEEKTATTHRFSEDGKWLFAWDRNSHVSVWNAATGELKFDKEIPTGVSSCAISNSNELTVFSTGMIVRYSLTSGQQLSQRRIYNEFGVLASNPQGTLIAGHSAKDKSIIFFDTVIDKQVGRSIPLPQEYKGGMPETALSADGRRFVFWITRDQWVWNRQVAVFDVETGKMISTFEPPGTYSVEEPVISPDGQYMFPSGGRSVFMPVDTATGKLVREIPDHILGVEKLSFTPDGHTLLVGSRDKRQAWNVDTGKPGQLFEKWYHTPNIAAVGNKSALVSGVKGGGFRLQSIESGAVEREYESAKGKYFAELQLAVDRKTFVAMESLQGGNVSRWNIANGKLLAERQLPSANYERRFDASKMIRGLTQGGSRVIRLEQVVRASKRPDGSIDPGRGELVLEDWASQTITNRLSIPAMGRVTFADSGDGTTFAAALSDDQTPRPYGEKWGSTHLLVWDVATGWERLRIDREMGNYFGAFAKVAITRDSRLAATVREHDRIEIWNGFNGYQLDAFDAGGEVTAIAFSNDGTTLATGHDDGSVFAWSVRTAWDQSVMPRPMNQRMAEQQWKDLAGEGRKPATAWQMLLGNPKRAVEMLKTNLKQAASAKGIAGVLENVVVPLPEKGDDSFDVCSPVPPIMRALQQALEKATTDEVRNKYKELLETASRPMPPETRRPLLGILLAEQLDTAESRKLIEEMAAGAAGAVETQVAKSALVRIRMTDALRITHRAINLRTILAFSNRLFALFVAHSPVADPIRPSFHNLLVAHFWLTSRVK